jgi:HAD superfamily hydrolase (TIGR01450 family)
MGMIGIILAAGIGSRLRPMTNTKPKCLVTTAGMPILQYQIDSYIEAGIKSIVLVIGYEGRAIRNYCKHLKDIDIQIIENPDYETTNNMYSLYLTRTAVGDNGFILNNADLSIDSSIVTELVNCPADDAVAVDTSLFNEESMKVSVDGDNRITNISKEISEGKSYACSIDFYKFSSRSSQTFFAEIESIIEGEKNLKDWTEVAMQRLMQNGRLSFQPCDISGKRWVEIDNYEDLALSDRVFSGLDDKLAEIDNILLDLDGTVYLGRDVVPGAVDAISRLRSMGKKIYFCSNNSSKTKSEYVERLTGLGIEASEDQIVLSTDGLIEYLNRQKVDNIHILGTNSFKKTFLDEGFRIDSDKPEYVVLGYDTELNYQKLSTACRNINNGVDMLATHCDAFCPTEDGPVPDIGAIIEMLKATTGKEPVKVFGKPNAEMVEPLIRTFLLDPRKTMIVGDRLHTDIRMAGNFDCHGMLVLSGETSRDQVETSPDQPDFILNSLGHL